MAKLGIEAMLDVDDQCRIRDQVADIREQIDVVLETTEVVVDGELTLEQAVELLEGIELICVVQQEAADGAPDEVRLQLWDLHHLHQWRRDRGVEPRHDALVDLQPLNIVPHVLGIDGTVDIVDEAKLPERGIEEGTPC
jgi:hypothetical protein